MQGQFSKPFDFLFSNPDYGPEFTSDQKLPDITTGKERVRDCKSTIGCKIKKKKKSDLEEAASASSHRGLSPTQEKPQERKGEHGPLVHSEVGNINSDNEDLASIYCLVT